MTRFLLRPVDALWQWAVNFHRRHFDPTEDADIVQLRRQEKQAVRATRDIESTGNFLRDRYLGQWEGNRDA